MLSTGNLLGSDCHRSILDMLTHPKMHNKMLGNKHIRTISVLRFVSINSISKRDIHPTVCVTGGWAGRGSAILTEQTSSCVKCLKMRRLPDVGCTLCWAAFMDRRTHNRNK